MDNQLKFNDEIGQCREKFIQALPSVMTAHQAFTSKVYNDGALSLKTKRLIALCIALRSGLTACILHQTKSAVEAGATKQEILEAVSVAIAIGGTAAFGSSWRVVKILEELGKW